MGSNILYCWYNDSDFSHELWENGTIFGGNSGKTRGILLIKFCGNLVIFVLDTDNFVMY